MRSAESATASPSRKSSQRMQSNAVRSRGVTGTPSTTSTSTFPMGWRVSVEEAQ